MSLISLKKELLIRTNCPDDRRAVYLEITAKGKQMMDEIFPKHQQVIEEVFQGISENDKETVIEVLKKVGHQAAEKE